MPPEIFTLTEFDDDDRGLTLRMQHGRDLGGVTPDGVEYDYNFIDYIFPMTAGETGARMYLEQPGTIYVQLSRAALGAPKAAAILRYLQRRFDRIMTLEDGIGYELSWVEGAAPELRNP
ncbi:hypothetical protein GXW71_15180 [Roseomonas hellenica]|uniref:Uncharacterized protein n=1 Tax=Plastoroseomonas hellenica TaxID=2687306 RepID=A0ABS5F0J8_9PROT|nr:hypothetical protein [Plastoroseomonas hellenica]MBR0665700.1 hypothetical protein [Plastoroseomonas hellenica]